MPYVLRDGSNHINAIMINPLDQNSEFLADSSDEIQCFHLKMQKKKEVHQEYTSRRTTLTVNSYTYSLEDPLYTNTGRAAIQALILGAGNVDIPDHKGVLHNLGIIQVNSLMNTLQDYLNALIENDIALIESINNATSLAELQAIDTTAGWPVQS